MENPAYSSQHNEAALNLLKEYIQSLNSFEATFEQSIYGQSGTVLESSYGIVRLQKPGKFYWVYQQPYRQYLISNGESIWIYDEDLEQVTINKIDRNAQNSPAALLSGEMDIESNYIVTDLGPLEDADWIELRSNHTDTEFNAIRLGFIQGELSGMVLFDNLGQTSELHFNDVLRDKIFDKSLFEFVPPAGIDIIDTRE
ncbi:MAG: outer membrane lipoprotein carrier protein [Gammaproteobacteria bacterium]|jgi:outer membrane lipoprotein carrier protein